MGSFEATVVLLGTVLWGGTLDLAKITKSRVHLEDMILLGVPEI